MEALLGSALTEHLREEELGLWTQGFDEIVGAWTDCPPASRPGSSRNRAWARRSFAWSKIRRAVAAAIYRDRDNRPVRVEGDFILCTLPFPVVTRLEVEPAFSEAKQRAIRELGYDSATKVLAVTRRRFWEQEEGIFGGGTYTDLPTATTWYPSDNATARDPKVSTAPAVFLASYSWGQTARRLATLPHTQRSALAPHPPRPVHPQLARAGEVRRTASWSWDNHRWSGGAFAWFMPGQWSALHRHVVAPEERIHLRGARFPVSHVDAGRSRVRLDRRARDPQRLAASKEQDRSPLRGHRVAIGRAAHAVGDGHRVALPLHDHVRIFPPWITRGIQEQVVGLLNAHGKHEHERSEGRGALRTDPARIPQPPRAPEPSPRRPDDARAWAPPARTTDC